MLGTGFGAGGGLGYGIGTVGVGLCHSALGGQTTYRTGSDGNAGFCTSGSFGGGSSVLVRAGAGIHDLVENDEVVVH